MMVVGKEDLGLSLSLACTTSTSNTATKTNNNNANANASVVVGGHGANKNHHNLGFMMMMNRNNHHINNNNNNNSHHGQMMNNNNSNSNASTPLQLNLMNPSLNSSNSTPHNTTHTSFLQKLQRNQSTDSFPLSDRNSDTCRLFLRGIDVNRPAGAGGSGGGDEEDAGVSSPNSTVSTISGKRSLSERDSAGAGDDLDGERASSRGLSDDEDGGENSRKKLRLTKDQSAILEESFKEHNTLNPKQKQALAKRLGLRPRQVEVWFQNRRARTKLKQTEVDCEFLKRCCEQLTEENRRLQKEVQELRTLKLSPQFYMQMTPPTTLTMCPSCERVAAPPGSAQPKLHPGPDSRAAAHRPMGANPWAVPNSVPIRSFDGLHPRA